MMLTSGGSSQRWLVLEGRGGAREKSTPFGLRKGCGPPEAARGTHIQPPSPFPRKHWLILRTPFPTSLLS